MKKYLVIVTFGSTNGKLTLTGKAEYQAEAVIFAMKKLNEMQRNDVINIEVMRYHEENFN